MESSKQAHFNQLYVHLNSAAFQHLTKTNKLRPTQTDRQTHAAQHAQTENINQPAKSTHYHFDDPNKRTDVYQCGPVKI